MSDDSKLTNALQYVVDSVKITSISNNIYDISEMVMEFYITESINSPYMQGRIVIADNEQNMMGNLPIQGRERISIKVKTPSSGKKYKFYTFDMTVYSIGGRSTNGKIQVYTLELISFEGLVNEGVRIGKVLKGSSDEMVKDIVKNILKSNKKVTTEKAKFPQKYLPTLKRPFDFIAHLARCSVSQSASGSIKAKPGGGVTSPSSSGSDLKINSTTKKLAGTAGYLFFETYDGYVFKSVDALCDVDGNFGGKPPTITYTYALSNVSSSDAENPFKIIQYNFTNEIDIMKQMRRGTYSTLCIFFDINSMDYSEYVYSVQDTYDQMAHLGSADKVPKGQKELSRTPTRVMSQMINHELFHDGIEPGITNAEHPDRYKYHLAQANARYTIAANQTLNIIVPPNLNIRAGDKLNIKIPNMTNTSLREEKPWDDEHSGFYLIKDISYNFVVKGSQPLTGSNTITLIRDSYGRKEVPSKVK